MGLRTRHPDPDVDTADPAPAGAETTQQEQPEVPAGPRVAGEWTFGTTLATKAVHACLLACLAAGPVALVVALPGSAPAPVAPTQVAASPAPDGSLPAAAAAQRLVVSWLTASQADAAALNAQMLEPVTSVDLQLPAERPAQPGRVWVEDVQPTSPGRWAVTVGAEGGAAGARSYYLVPVQADQTGASPLTLPARTTAPAPASTDSVDDRTDLMVGANDPAAVTVRGYLTALLTGTGDLDRWTAPEATLTAIEPAPCRTVDVQEVKAAVDDLPKPDLDGVEVPVVAAATCTPRAGAATVSQYPLVLRARGDRWEVARTNPGLTDPPPVSPAPSVSVSSTSPQPR